MKSVKEAMIFTSSTSLLLVCIEQAHFHLLPSWLSVFCCWCYWYLVLLSSFLGGSLLMHYLLSRSTWFLTTTMNRVTCVEYVNVKKKCFPSRSNRVIYTLEAMLIFSVDIQGIIECRSPKTGRRNSRLLYLYTKNTTIGSSMAVEAKRSDTREWATLWKYSLDSRERNHYYSTSIGESSYMYTCTNHHIRTRTRIHIHIHIQAERNSMLMNVWYN